MSKSELSPGLLAALALTAKHIEPVEPIQVLDRPLPSPSVRVKAVHISHLTKKVRLNRKRRKLAAQSRKRNRR